MAYIGIYRGDTSFLPESWVVLVLFVTVWWLRLRSILQRAVRNAQAVKNAAHESVRRTFLHAARRSSALSLPALAGAVLLYESEPGTRLSQVAVGVIGTIFVAQGLVLLLAARWLRCWEAQHEVMIVKDTQNRGWNLGIISSLLVDER